MIKKLILTTLLVSGSFNAYPDVVQPTIVTLQIIRKGGASNGNTKTPDLPLLILQDDHVFTTPPLDDDLFLELYDDNGFLAYSLFIPAGTTQFVLLSTLSGNFELRLVCDTYYYIGYINL